VGVGISISDHLNGSGKREGQSVSFVILSGDCILIVRNAQWNEDNGKRVSRWRVVDQTVVGDLGGADRKRDIVKEIFIVEIVEIRNSAANLADSLVSSRSSINMSYGGSSIHHITLNVHIIDNINGITGSSVSISECVKKPARITDDRCSKERSTSCKVESKGD